MHRFDRVGTEGDGRRAKARDDAKRPMGVGETFTDDGHGHVIQHKVPKRAGGINTYKNDEWVDKMINPPNPAKAPEAPVGWGWADLLSGWEEENRKELPIEDPNIAAQLAHHRSGKGPKVYRYGRDINGDEVEIRSFEHELGETFAPKVKRIGGEDAE